MNYTDFANRIAGLTAIDVNDQAGVYAQALPSAIDYAEQRIYRELQLAVNSTRMAGFATAPLGHVLTLPTGTFVAITGISVVLPPTTRSPDAGTRKPLTPVSWDFIDAIYDSAASAGVPSSFALQDACTIAFGPWPDQAYTLEITGTVRPPPLSANNSITWLTLYLPDLFVAAAMVFMSGFMRNYGAQSDDPAQGVTWESQYQRLLGSAKAEEVSKMFGVGG